MGRVIADISMSLDGFITASDRTPDEPMGQGGEKLHEWAFGQDERSSELLEQSIEALGALSADARRTTTQFGGGGPTAPRATELETFADQDGPPPLASPTPTATPGPCNS